MTVDGNIWKWELHSWELHSYWLKMKMMEWSVNASPLRHSNNVGGPAFRVPRSRRLPWTSFLFSRGAAVVDGSSRTPVATCQNSGYEITALQRPCKVWERRAELRPRSFFWRPVWFSFSSSKRDKRRHFSSALQRRKKKWWPSVLGIMSLPFVVVVQADERCHFSSEPQDRRANFNH